MSETNGSQEEQVQETQQSQQQESQLGTNVKKGAEKAKKAADTAKKVKDVAGKALKHGAGKSSLLAAMAPVLFWVAIILLIIIIVIGLVMFFITMPGMLMDKLKALFNQIADVVRAFFGNPTYRSVDDKEIYEVLDYIESMGYDLKGYGFVTDFRTPDEVEEKQKLYASGVIKDEEDKIVKAYSDIIRAYIISDNYVYTLKNKTLDTSWHDALWQHTRSLFGAGYDPEKTTGLIAVWTSDGIGNRDKFYSDGGFSPDNMDINPKAKTLKIKKGFFNNAMTYSLEGWTGRYGMPLEFLLSIHSATLMPDLAYNMATGFRTEVNLLLHSVSGSSVDGAFKNKNGEYIRYKDFENIADDGLFGWFGQWYINKEEALKIMKKYHIDSPDDCLGGEGVGTDQIKDEETIEISFKDSSGEALTGDSLTSKRNEAINKFNAIIDELKTNGYGQTYEDNSQLPLNKVSSWYGYLNLMKELENRPDEGTNDSLHYIWGYPTSYSYKIKYSYSEKSRSALITISWPAKESEPERSIYTATITMSYDNYTENRTGNQWDDYSYTNYSESILQYNTKITYQIEADWSDSKIDEYLENKNLEDLSQVKCSHKAEQDNSMKKCCAACRRYIQKIYDKLKDIHDGKFSYYFPYIENVMDHWFRNVYFTDTRYSDNDNDGEDDYNDSIDGKLAFVKYDYDYEAVVKERWTLYETYSSNPNDKYYNEELAGEYVYFKIDDEGKFLDPLEIYVPSDNELMALKYDKDVILKNPELIAESGFTEEEIKNFEIKEKFAKKPKTINATDTEDLKDFGWQKHGSVWSAYNKEKYDTDWEQVYPDSTDNVDTRLYSKIQNGSIIIQTGEGQRAQTNPKIKKMFLSNKYFRYDQSQRTAEIIHNFRTNVVKEFGPISEDTIKQNNHVYLTFKNNKKYVSGAEDGFYDLADFVGTPTISQKSLEQFSILENTHTLDADYIYRDFKELIVELGYFKKEELTDETPRLLQWAVPDIGSYGYPNRSIDKREQEYGTTIHSKKDIAANEKYILSKIIKAAGDEEGEGEEGTTQIASAGTTLGGNLGTTLGIGSTINISEVGAVKIPVGKKRPSQISAKDFCKKTRKMCEEINRVGFDYCQMNQEKKLEDGTTVNACDNNPTWHSVHHNDQKDPPSHALCNTFEEANQQESTRNFCCATLISWALQNVGVKGTPCIHGAEALGDWIIENLKAKKIEKGQPLKEGDILWYKGHIDMVGLSLGGGKFEKYNGGHYTEANSVEYQGSSCIEELNGWPNDSKLICALRIPWAGSDEGSKYEGYEGNEPVVSPVTGILLEYGTYTADDIDSIVEEEYRVNTDLKYGINDQETSVATDDSETTEEQTDEESEVVGDIVHDKVGHAKILVLDADNYKKLEGASDVPSKWQNETNSLVKIKKDSKPKSDDGISYDTTKAKAVFTEALDNTKQMDDENWSLLDKTVYGYKEFAESYERFGIAGYVVDIDGFVCELPVELEEDEEDKDISEMVFPANRRKKLKYDDFKITPGNLESALDKEDCLVQSIYEGDKEYKLASKKATEKLEAEGAVKFDASPVIYTQGLTFIKEGTIIGRTMTDRELIEEVRKEKPSETGKGFEDYYRPSVSDTEGSTTGSTTGSTAGSGTDMSGGKENVDKVTGNYIRMIMRDLDDTVVENIEDYIKLDEKAKTSLDLDLEFFFWSPYEGGAWGNYEKYMADYDITKHGTRKDIGSGPTIIEVDGDVSLGKVSWSLAVGISQWTNNSNGLNNLSPLCEYLAAYDPMLSPLQDLANKSADFYNENLKTLQETWHNICSTEEGYNKMLEGQMKYTYEESWLNTKETTYQAIVEWAKERPMSLQGHIFAVMNWGNYKYNGGHLLDTVSDSKSDYDNTEDLGEACLGHSEEIGMPSGRWASQSQLCVDIFNGKISEEQLKEWIETKNMSDVSPGYGEGKYSFPISE